MTIGDRFGRGLLYAILMLYLFIGVAIVSDKFMESIEMITAQEKEMSVVDPRTGKSQIIIVKVWNETVANLSLMALGSSAPEIMLSVIEIWAKGFHAGELGPGTIVAVNSGALLLLVFVICLLLSPGGGHEGSHQGQQQQVSRHGRHGSAGLGRPPVTPWGQAAGQKISLAKGCLMFW